MNKTASGSEVLKLRALTSEILTALRGNLLRGTIETSDNEQFEKMLGIWGDRFFAAMLPEMNAPKSNASELIHAIRALMPEMTQDERLWVVGRIKDGYCPDCMTKHLPCHCWSNG